MRTGSMKVTNRPVCHACGCYVGLHLKTEQADNPCLIYAPEEITRDYDVSPHFTLAPNTKEDQ